MSGKASLFKLIRFYARETWSFRTLGFFALMLLLSGFLLWGMPGLAPDASQIFPPVSFSIVDLDDSLLSRKLTEQIADMRVIEQVHVEPLADAKVRLDANESLLIMIIPDGFYESSIRSEQRPTIDVYLNSRKPVETAVFVRFLDNLSSSIEGVQSAYFAYAASMRPLYPDEASYTADMDEAATHIVFQVLGRRSIVDVDQAGKLDTVRFVISSLICLLTMQTSLLLLTQVQQERRSGVRERLLLAGVSWWQPTLARQVIGLCWLAAGFAPLLAGLFRVYPDAARWTVILSVLILYWVTALLCQTAAYLAKPNDTVLLGVWLGVLALMLLGGSIYPAPLLPEVLRKVGPLTPVHWAFQSAYHALGGQPATPAALLAGGLMVLAATVAVAIGWRNAGIAMQNGGMT